MELDDCAFPLLTDVEIGDDADSPSAASTWLLVGARPRKKGMERGDLLEANGAIFAAGPGAQRPCRRRRQGAGRRQPGQHERLIAMSNAPDIPQSGSMR